MENIFLETFIQFLSIVDGLSVSLILGSVTLLALLEITRKDEKEKDRGTLVATGLLWVAVLVQLVYRGIDLVITGNMLSNRDIQFADISPVYLVSLLLTLSAVALFVMKNKNKVQLSTFIFSQAAIWYTLFIVSQVISRSPLFASFGAFSHVLLAIVLIIIIVLILDSYKKYFLKKKNK
jgi:predicted permease